jgi:glycyl-tRNA synthetase beta chain
MAEPHQSTSSESASSESYCSESTGSLKNSSPSQREDTSPRDLLIELGTEELPHGIMDRTGDAFRRSFVSLLREHRIKHGEVSLLFTPRRITLLIREIHPRQDDYRQEKRGPSVQKAYLPDGKPSAALLGFLKGNAVGVEDVEEKETNGGRYIYLVRDVRGSETDSVLPDLLDRCLRSLNFPKTMRWENQDLPFPRPIRWLVFLFGEKVNPYQVAGVQAGRHSWGHRAYSSDSLAVSCPDAYEETLLAAGVIADQEKRRSMIQQEVAELAGEHGLRVPPEAEGLYRENANLTEQPRAVLCSFEEEFLSLPREVLISEMIEHQHYFPLEQADGMSLSNLFIAVSNIRDNGETRDGYQRVLRARLNDGAFFYDEDHKNDLKALGERLHRVLFHKQLGTMSRKVERIADISGMICSSLNLSRDQTDQIEQVAMLCKNDLTTLMVGEFPHLQGVMGSYYALFSGYGPEVARGIREHYQPRFASDQLPDSIQGAVVGIADRLDTMMGIFSIGLKPKGSKDPFGLRRSVLAVVRIIIHLHLHLSLHRLLREALQLYRGAGEQTKSGADPEGPSGGVSTDVLLGEIEDFFISRIRTIFFDMGFSHDEIEASLGSLLEDPYEAYRRVDALHRLRGDRDFEDLLISFKRMSNITRDVADLPDTGEISEELLTEPQEKELYTYFLEHRDDVLEGIWNRDYTGVYRILSTFKPYVDRFFDHVLVMDENLRLRRNRIALLTAILGTFSDIIDFSKIVLPGE